MPPIKKQLNLIISILLTVMVSGCAHTSHFILNPAIGIPYEIVQPLKIKSDSSPMMHVCNEKLIYINKYLEQYQKLLKKYVG